MTPPDDAPRAVTLEMIGWDGRQSAPRRLANWQAALAFVASPEFRPMRNVRKITLREVNAPPEPGGNMTQEGWRPSQMQAAAIAARGERDMPCGACGADPGQPCTDPPPGRTVHGSRWVAAARAAKGELRSAYVTPEARAALARLPRIPAEEIEACRLPGGGYSFTRQWFLAHNLPYPPVSGWLKAVTRPEDTGPEEDARP